MSALRRLCQVLLNGTPGPDDLRAAEDFLAVALAEAGGAGDAPDVGAPWRAPALPEPACPLRRRLALRMLAPTLLLDGTWLARVPQPASGHLETESRLLALYTALVGVDDPAAAPPLRFRAALDLAGVYLPPLASPLFFADSGLPEMALRLPAAILALLHRPRSRFPELLGFTLAYACREPEWWDALAEGVDRGRTRALAAEALAAWPEREAQSARARAGWRLHLRLFGDLCRAIAFEIQRPSSAEDAVAALVSAKREQAIGYHRRVSLAGCSLDDWLSEPDPRPMLRALRAAGRVDRACPEGSRLIRAMDFGGPMFGVFDTGERQAVLNWIENPDAPAVPVVDTPAAPELPPGRPASDGLPAAPQRLPARQLYLALLRAESPAECPPAAHRYIDGVLRRTRVLRLFRRGEKRGFAYSPAAFTDYVENQHRHEVERYRPLSGPPPVSRDFCRWAVRQLAPAILVDGAWLAGMGTAAEKLGDIGRHLFKTYADELGDGLAFRNHPNVYRRLLAAEGLALPPFDSAEFAADRRFLDAAFHIPAYLLAMGLATERYFPELLGLNLAIELSGLGAGYLRAAELLRLHGMDPAIIDLHLSIDNLASGHAARARESIVLYLDGQRRAGPEAVQGQWQRIWTGYLSLDVAALGLAAGFAVRFYRERAEWLPDWMRPAAGRAG